MMSATQTFPRRSASDTARPFWLVSGSIMSSYNHQVLFQTFTGIRFDPGADLTVKDPALFE